MASRWLTSVGKFLEKLDDQAKDVVEEQFRRKIDTTNNNSNENNSNDNSSSLYSTNDTFDNNNNSNNSNDADSKINNLLAAKGLQLSFNSSNKKQSFSDSVSTTTDSVTAEKQKITHHQHLESGISGTSSNFFDDNDDFFQDTTTTTKAAVAAATSTQIPNDTIQTQLQQQQDHHQKQLSQPLYSNNNNETAGWGTEEEDDDFFDDIDMNTNENVIVTVNAQIPTIEPKEGVESIVIPHTTFPEIEQKENEQQQQLPALLPNNVNENHDQSILTSDESSFSEQQEQEDEQDLNKDHQQNVDDTVVVDQLASTAASDANNIIDVLQDGEQYEDEPMQIKSIEATATDKEMLERQDSEPDDQDVIDQKSTSSATDTEFTNNNNTTPSIDWDTIIQTKLQEQEMILIQMSQEREDIIRNEYKNEIWNMNNTIQSLKNDLELSGREINAQQKELDTVAIRIDKDRIKNKEIIDTLNSRYNTDILSLKVQHDTSIKEIQKQHNEQIVSLQEQYRQLELSKIHEDVTYNKDLDKIVQREQILQQQYNSIVDEKEILLQQIETLQQQQISLAGRIESLTVMSEGAYQREQESEHRYDDTLQLHAKQIQQRQIRESELERTITELTAALASLSSNGVTSSTTAAGAINNQNGVSMMNTRDQLLIQIQTLEHENETIKLQLSHELARSTALEQEIQQITKHRDDDTNVIVNQIKQQYEQTITELQQKIGNQSDPDNNNNSNSNNKSSEYEQNEYEGERINDKKDQTQKQQQHQQIDTYVKKIKSLTEETLRQREKLGSYSSEVSTLRTRLNVALNRATIAEAVAEQQQQQIPFGSPDNLTNNNSNSYTTSSSSSRAPGSGIRINKRRNNNNETNFPSMRKAFMIDTNDTLLLSSSNSSNCTTYTTITKFGNVLDATDTVLSKSGRVLRYNPFARLFFVMYLFSLHTWTFVVIFFHAHSLDHTNTFNQLQLQQNGFPNIISSPHNLQPLLTLTQDNQKNGIVPSQVQNDVKKKISTTDTAIDNKKKT